MSLSHLGVLMDETRVATCSEMMFIVLLLHDNRILSFHSSNKSFEKNAVTRNLQCDKPRSRVPALIEKRITMIMTFVPVFEVSHAKQLNSFHVVFELEVECEKACFIRLVLASIASNSRCSGLHCIRAVRPL
jgi:hypothetical protein